MVEFLYWIRLIVLSVCCSSNRQLDMLQKNIKWMKTQNGKFWHDRFCTRVSKLLLKDELQLILYICFLK